ncbi:MAG: hypothetical protein PHV34_18410 [Verrucomicrobiae bacterium]|nr:hypothetical protein [Verrucomicrobiae bacterium]
MRDPTKFKTVLLWLVWSGLAMAPWFWQKHPIFCQVPGIVLALLGGLWGWGQAAATGWMVLSRFSPLPGEPPPPLAILRQLLLSAGLGLGLHSVLILACGSLGCIGFVPLAALHLALLVLTWKAWGEILRLSGLILRQIANRPFTVYQVMMITALAVVFFFTLPFVFTPTLNLDALRYHFGLSRLFHQAGVIFQQADFAETGTSLNWQMLYLVHLTLFNETSAQFFNWLTLPMLLLTVAAAVPSGGRWLSVWFFLGIPFILGESVHPNNDLGMGFFCALAFLSLRETPVRHSFLLSGLFMGMATGTKYPALLAVAGMTAGLAASNGSTWRERGRRLGFFILGTTLGYLPWLARNFCFSGDPFYPALSGWLPWATENGRWTAEHYAREMGNYGAGLTAAWRFILAPWRVTISFPVHFESELGLLPWISLPFILLRAPWKTPFCRTIGLTLLFFGLLWAAGHQVTRFLLAALPGLVMLAGETWAQPSAGNEKFQRPSSILFTIILIPHLWISALIILQSGHPGVFFGERLSTGEYRCRHSQNARAAAWLAADSRISQRVLLAGIDDCFLFSNPLRYSGPFDPKWHVIRAARSASPSELARHFQNDGIRYICLDWERSIRLEKQFGYLQWPSRESLRRFWQCLEENSRTVYRDGPCEIREFMTAQKPKTN